MTSPKISVIIPTGGVGRSIFLDLAVKHLKDSRYGKDCEYVLVEVDKTTRVPRSTKERFDKYVFIKSEGLFNLGKARNVGAKESSGDLLIFHDNDLLCPPTFLVDTVQDFKKSLCAGTTWSNVNYLNKNFSTKILSNKVKLTDVERDDVVGTYSSATVHGGSIWAERQLFFDIKGFDESFEGWGCEDDAFWLKVKSTLKWTNGKRTSLYHLYHEASGIEVDEARRSNPKYSLHRQRLEKMYAYDKQDWLKHIENIS